MKVEGRDLRLVEVPDVLALLKDWVRESRQNEKWTQADLARRSGVPATTISRLERTGLVSTDALFRILFALNRLDALSDFLKERKRLELFQMSLSDSRAMRPVQRVRHAREASA